MVSEHRAAAPEDQLAKEMTHDLEVNFNKIAPFGKEDTAKELQSHAAKTQDTLVDAVENAEVAEIKRAVFRALTRLRAATIKESVAAGPPKAGHENRHKTLIILKSNFSKNMDFCFSRKNSNFSKKSNLF